MSEWVGRWVSEWVSEWVEVVSGDREESADNTAINRLQCHVVISGLGVG